MNPRTSRPQWVTALFAIASLVTASLCSVAAAQQERTGSAGVPSAAATSIPDESRLKTRILDFYRALGSKNAQVLYEMQTPYLRSETSFDAFRRESGLDEAWQSQPATTITAELAQACYCREWKYPDGTGGRRCVLLLGAVEETADKQQRQSQPLLAMWDYTQGEWYYGRPGEGDHCPPEAELLPDSQQGPQAAAGPPDEARLKVRLDEHTKASVSRNARAMYEMLTPYMRSHMSFDDYKRDMRFDEAWARQPRMQLTAELERSCSCGSWMYPDGSETVRCVLLMKGMYGEAGARPAPVTWLEMWEYALGEWYHGVSLEGDQCPSESPPPRTDLEEVPLPDEARLRIRLQDFYDALVSQDAGRLYELETPDFRSRVPLDKYQQHGVPLRRKLLVGTPTKVTVGIEQVCACHRVEWPYDRILCRVLVDEVPGSTVGAKQMTRHLELWEYSNGEWFIWLPKTDEQCPPKENQ
jgi:hypothetical protein